MQVEALTINGWDVSTWVNVELGAGRKCKQAITFDLEDADISSPSEITSMEVRIKILNTSNDSTIDERTVKLVPVFDR